jgi:hypothetical protein
MIKYLGAAAALAAAYGVEGAIELTAIALAALASMFYFLTTRLFIGLSQASLVKDVDVLYMSMVYMIHVTMAALVFISPYSYVAFIALPWLVIQGIANMMSVLLKLDIIDIHDSE